MGVCFGYLLAGNKSAIMMKGIDMEGIDKVRRSIGTSEDSNSGEVRRGYRSRFRWSENILRKIKVLTGDGGEKEKKE